MTTRVNGGSGGSFRRSGAPWRGPLLGLLLAVPSLAPSGGAAAKGPNEAVLTATQAQRPASLSLLQDLVNLDSGTGDVEGGARVLEVLEPRLRAIGAEVRHVAAAAPGLPDALIATLHGRGRARILLIGHIDTVFAPGVAKARPFRVDGDRAYGPGVGDEKGGVVVGVAALTILHRLNYDKFGDITLLLDNSEEKGSPGAVGLIHDLARHSDVELNLEPGDPPDALTVWRKGATTIKIAVKGRAAHAGIAPQNGRNAATELVNQITALSGRFPTSGDQTTVNLTLMKAGSRDNIIPEDAEAVFNVRFRSAQDFEAVLAAAEAAAKAPKVPDTVLTVSHAEAFPPLTTDAGTRRLAERASAIYAELSRPIALSGNGGASESALAQADGIPALDGLGLVGGDFHTDKEWVDLSTLTPRTYLLTRLLMSLSEDPPSSRRE